MRGMRIALIFASVWLLFSSCLTTTINAETTENAPMTSAGLETIIKNKDNTEVTISYVLENKKELILKTDQANMIDLSALKAELGADKVKEDADKKELILTLDKPETIDFKIMVDKKMPFLLSVLDADRNLLFDYQFNQAEKYDLILDDDDDPSEEATWTQTGKNRLSKGPILEHADGSSTQPYLYFGDYEEAVRPTATLESSWGPRGKSRQNSLTAPNSAILYAEPGSRIEDGPKSVTNHVYTSHYGDNQRMDNSVLPDDEDDTFGVPTSYTSNNIFNEIKHTDDWNGLRPGVSGPNKVGKSYAMIDTPKLYYRTDQKTGLEEQRLVYKQRAYWEDKKGRYNPEITTSIKLSFSKTGKVITSFTFKNTGKETFSNFNAFSNHDLSLNKDGNEITDPTGKKIGNFIPMRALGNERGMYFQSPNNEIRTSIYMNRQNMPHAWAARSASRSYLATKGFMYNPGILGLIAASSETYYPWKVGKSKGNSNFYDKKEKHYKFPYTPKDHRNAFYNQLDMGDKDQGKGANTRLGTNSESDPQWDAGVTMRTKPQDLAVGKTVKMEYGTMTDVPGTTFNPVVEFDNLGTDDEPQILPLDTENLTLSGNWYDFDSNHVTLYYGIDSDEEDNMHNVLFHQMQTDKEAEGGALHDFKNDIRIKGLEKGAHKIYLIAIDEDSNQSVLQEHAFKLIKPATKEPQIDVTSPSGTKKDPYAPTTDHFALNGFWSDKDSKKISTITYKIDDGEEINYSKNLDNSKPGSLVPWRIEDLDVKKFNDFKIHTVKFKITDSDGNVGTTEFYFRHIGGGINLVAPEEIDFGQLSVSPTSQNQVKPNMQEGKVLLDDFREKGANQIGVSLSIGKFYKTDDSGTGGDDGDDGDDSGSSGDLDRDDNKESLLHNVYWDGQLVDNLNLLVGKTEDVKNQDWRETTDFTDEIVKKLKINFRAGENGAPVGKYVSRWTWNIVDSIQ